MPNLGGLARGGVIVVSGTRGIGTIVGLGPRGEMGYLSWEQAIVSEY